jgi:hypothetical protein
VVPEYLRDPPKKSRLLPAAAVMLVVGAALGLLLLVLGQFNPGTPLGNALQRVQAKLHGKAADDEDRDDGDFKKGLTDVEESAKTLESPATGSNGAPASKSGRSAPAGAIASGVPAAGNPLAASGKSEAPVPAAERPLVAIPGKAPEATAASSPAARAALPPAGVATIPETQPRAGGKSPVLSVAGRNLRSAEPGPEPKPLPGGSTLGSPPARPPVEVARIDSLPAPKTGITPPVLGPAAEEKTKIGRFLSDGQDVLLKSEANNAGWRRVLPEEFLAGRQPLLALPSYRPRVAVLNVGATLELVNGTRIELLPDNAQGQPGVDIQFGRVVIKPLAQTGTRLRVVAGSHAGTLTLTNMESIAGLEVRRVHDPGTDPEKVLSHALTKLYVARGGALWEEGEGKQPVRLTAPAELMLDGAETDTPLGAEKDLPKWLTANTVNELDQRAAQSVSQALPADRAASLGLMELTEDRRKEIRWLATRCLGYLGHFDPMTAALNDADFRGEWPDYFDQLKEAIARGPETAAAIRQSLEKQYGNDSAALYRMLWGYTDKDLEDGEDVRLVNFLEHEVLAFRVLAFWNLADITHLRLFYHPEATAARRLQSLQQWQRQQKLGRIRFHVPEGKPPGAPAALPPKETPGEPKPRDDGPPAEVKPTSATEPLAPGISSIPGAAAATAIPPERLPVSVSEPDRSERRPRIAYPEP